MASPSHKISSKSINRFKSYLGTHTVIKHVSCLESTLNISWEDVDFIHSFASVEEQKAGFFLKVMKFGFHKIGEFLDWLSDN
jgi:hypothetical protein